METTDYCSYKLALALKKCGFDMPCDHCYAQSDDGEKRLMGMVNSHDYNAPRHGEPLFILPICSAPTLWQAQKWLREVKQCDVTVYAQPYNGLPYYTGYILLEGDETEVLDGNGQWFDDYEKAMSETISSALQLLDNEKKNEHTEENTTACL